jgi:hypothetical protein
MPCLLHTFPWLTLKPERNQISYQEAKDRNTPGSIWVLGLGKDPANRFVRRVDHGAATGAPTVVLEPEPFVGKHEVFVYYNFFDRAKGRHGLRRAATGITKDKP